MRRISSGGQETKPDKSLKTAVQRAQAVGFKGFVGKESATKDPSVYNTIADEVARMPMPVQQWVKEHGIRIWTKGTPAPLYNRVFGDVGEGVQASTTQGALTGKSEIILNIRADPENPKVMAKVPQGKEIRERLLHELGHVLDRAATQKNTPAAKGPMKAVPRVVPSGSKAWSELSKQVPEMEGYAGWEQKPEKFAAQFAAYYSKPEVMNQNVRRFFDWLTQGNPDRATLIRRIQGVRTVLSTTPMSEITPDHLNEAIRESVVRLTP